jgi:hypothetical protein
MPWYVTIQTVASSCLWLIARRCAGGHLSEQVERLPLHCCTLRGAHTHSAATVSIYAGAVSVLANDRLITRECVSNEGHEGWQRRGDLQEAVLKTSEAQVTQCLAAGQLCPG